ncbi:lipoprotein [Vitreoscilla massiliensis]|uniref:Lipoprotein n=2 Tax=Vitreoscilla massiliensis TaxID=1689272 RepID=A0ABY4E705_9NEIS|nr:lipoprotein [Vitreoscilla massiliensis]UOO91244.1 lipoprotein [Vitreoscilla massiliensis]HRL02343.1 lipoprotein [Vitreoscilla sp.]
MGVLCTLLSACGFKGGLYLPKENDKQTFGAVQTGFGIDKRPNQVSPTMQNNPQPF